MLRKLLPSWLSLGSWSATDQGKSERRRPQHRQHHQGEGDSNKTRSLSFLKPPSRADGRRKGSAGSNSDTGGGCSGDRGGGGGGGRRRVSIVALDEREGVSEGSIAVSSRGCFTGVRVTAQLPGGGKRFSSSLNFWNFIKEREKLQVVSFPLIKRKRERGESSSSRKYLTYTTYSTHTLVIHSSLPCKPASYL